MDFRVRTDFNYDGIDTVTFTTAPSQQFAMDNLTVTVPEPSLLGILGIGTTAIFLRRRR